MVNVPASAQQSSSEYQSIAKELGSFTCSPVKKICLPVPSSLAHSNFGAGRYQSDQKIFLKNFKFHNFNFIQSLLALPTLVVERIIISLPPVRVDCNASGIDKTFREKDFPFIGIQMCYFNSFISRISPKNCPGYPIDRYTLGTRHLSNKGFRFRSVIRHSRNFIAYIGEIIVFIERSSDEKTDKLYTND